MISRIKPRRLVHECSNRDVVMTYARTMTTPTLVYVALGFPNDHEKTRLGKQFIAVPEAEVAAYVAQGARRIYPMLPNELFTRIQKMAQIAAAVNDAVIIADCHRRIDVLCRGYDLTNKQMVRIREVHPSFRVTDGNKETTP